MIGGIKLSLKVNKIEHDSLYQTERGSANRKGFNAANFAVKIPYGYVKTSKISWNTGQTKVLRKTTLTEKKTVFCNWEGHLFKCIQIKASQKMWDDSDGYCTTAGEV